MTIAAFGQDGRGTVAGGDAASHHAATGGTVSIGTIGGEPLAGRRAIAKGGAGTGSTVGLHPAKLVVGAVALGLLANGLGRAVDELLGVCGRLKTRGRKKSES